LTCGSAAVVPKGFMRAFAPVVLLICTVLFFGCNDESPAVQASNPDAADAAGAGTVPAVAQWERQYVTTLEGFPEWVPLPDEYVVIVGAKSRGVGSIAIETSGDPRSVVEHLNEQLTARGLTNIKETKKEGRERFVAQGVVNFELRHAIINVSEYDAGGAMKPGNTVSISYMIGG
jgi:hypothetical protein